MLAVVHVDPMYRVTLTNDQHESEKAVVVIDKMTDKPSTLQQFKMNLAVH